MKAWAGARVMHDAELLSVEDLTRHFSVRRGLVFGKTVGVVRAVDGISFTLDRGETLALVGESAAASPPPRGCVLRLIDPTAGTIRFEGTDITEMRGDPLRRLRRRMQIVFQDPFASLNPRMTVGEILEEPLIVHDIGDRTARRARVNQLLGSGRPAHRIMRNAIRTSSPAASASGSASRVRSPWSPLWWCATNRSQRWMCRSRRRW